MLRSTTRKGIVSPVLQHLCGGWGETSSSGMVFVSRGITTTTTTTTTGSRNDKDDTHDDFKPRVKAMNTEASSEETVHDMITRDVTDHTVFVYMKGQPAAPMCGFSNMACRILDSYQVRYGSRDVLADPVLREGIKSYTKWPTIPQIFIQGEFVGGSDILLDMHKSGELLDVLQSSTSSDTS